MATRFNNTGYTHVLVLDALGTVFGVGVTEAEALADAEQWSDTLSGLECYEATEAAYEHAKSRGADASRDLRSTERPNLVRLAAAS